MTISRERIYAHLPIPVQNRIISWEGKRLERRRYQGSWSLLYREVLQRQILTIDQLHYLQEQRLRNFLQTASRAHFWAESFSHYDVNTQANDACAELKKLPILNRQEVQSNLRGIMPADIAIQKCIPVHTSGSTGSGLQFWTTRQAEQEQWAIWWRYRAWHGIDRTMWCGYFGGRSIVPISQKMPPFWRINRPGKQILFSAYHFTAERIIAYVNALNKFKVSWIHGYPSLLTLVAHYIKESGIPAPPALRIITTGAENLMIHQRNLLQEVFGVPVFNHYGQAEAVANASECALGRLHIDEDFSCVECIPISNQPGTYKIVGSNWSNPAFPLLRYDTGDVVRIANGTCPCGKNGRILDEIDGRKEDFVILPNGVRLGRLDHIFKDLVHIREAQIYQPSVDRVVFRIVKGNRYDSAGEEQKLLQESRQRLGNDINISIEYATTIPKTKTGKLRFVVSEIKFNY